MNTTKRRLENIKKFTVGISCCNEILRAKNQECPQKEPHVPSICAKALLTRVTSGKGRGFLSTYHPSLRHTAPRALQTARNWESPSCQLHPLGLSSSFARNAGLALKLSVLGVRAPPSTIVYRAGSLSVKANPSAVSWRLDKCGGSSVLCAVPILRPLGSALHQHYSLCLRNFLPDVLPYTRVVGMGGGRGYQVPEDSAS